MLAYLITGPTRSAIAPLTTTFPMEISTLPPRPVAAPPLSVLSSIAKVPGPFRTSERLAAPSAQESEPGQE